MEKSEKSGSDNPCGAVVLSSSYTALAIVRSLGRKDIPVWILDNKASPTGLSRYVKRSFPLNLENELGQFELLVEIAQKYNLVDWALFPDSDKGATFIAKYYHELSKYYKLTTPPWDILKWAVDKRLTYQLAAEVHVGFPKVFYPKNRFEVEELDGRFPMILKPAHHQLHDIFSTGRAWQANDRTELLKLYDEICEVTDSSIIMIQEMISVRAGNQLSYGALCKDGQVLADAFAERVRLDPPEFGTSTYIELIKRPEIEGPSKRFLEKINYTGIVEIDFMLDERDGSYKLLDVNARAWGWIAMCAYAGVDFPYLMWKLIRGENIAPIHARAGVRWIRTMDDLRSSIKLMQKGSLSLGKYFASLKGVRHQLYVSDDLKPSIVDFYSIRDWLIVRAKKMLGGKPRVV
jgi:D-aspartate ligase